MKRLSKPSAASIKATQATLKKQAAIVEFLNSISSDELQERDLPFKLYFNHKLMNSTNRKQSNENTKN